MALEKFEQDFLDSLDKNKIYTLKEASDIFNNFIQSSDKGVGFGVLMEFNELLSKSLMLDKDILKDIKDEDIIKLLKNRYTNIFKEADFKNNGLNPGNHIYNALCIMPSQLSQLNKIKSLEYILNNVNLEDIDINYLALYGAIQNKNEDIVKVLLKNVSNFDKYGIQDRITDRIVYELLKLDFEFLSKETMEELKKIKHIKFPEIHLSDQEIYDKYINEYKNLTTDELMKKSSFVQNNDDVHKMQLQALLDSITEKINELKKEKEKEDNNMDFLDR